MRTSNDTILLLAERCNKEGLYILSELEEQGRPVPKQQLKSLVNQTYKEINPNIKDTLISSRYFFDIQCARLEGAGLVDVEVIGRIRRYSISFVGIEVLRIKEI